jgi:hypothetical protein
MSEPREWLIDTRGVYTHIEGPDIDYSEIKVIEKSAYDQLRAENLALREALGRIVNSEVIKQADMLWYSEAYSNARAMLDDKGE